MNDRTPDPRCTSCGGRGWYTYYQDAHTGNAQESCDCWKRALRPPVKACEPERTNVVRVDFKKRTKL
jgi:hypothetical protein